MEKLLELNLIRNRMNVIETRRQYSRYLRIFFVFASIAFIAVTYNFIRDTNKDMYLKKEFKTLQADIAEKRKVFDIQNLEKKWRDYNWKLKTINYMLNDRSAWGNRLKELANMLPAGMCISNVDISNEQGGKSRYYIELLVSQNEEKVYKQVDGYMNAVETNKYFGKGVKLQSHERKKVNNKEIEIFQILLSTNPVNKTR